MGLFSRLFGSTKNTDNAPSTAMPTPIPPQSSLPRQQDGAHESWYFPAGTDESVFIGAEGQPALHLVEYTDGSGERILRLIDDRTGLLVGPTDRRLPKLGIWVGQLRGESHNSAGCTAGDFEPGATVTVTPELTNVHDPNAIVVHDATAKHRAGYFNKQKARAMKRTFDSGVQLAAISLRGTRAGIACKHVTVIAATPEVLRHLTEPRPESLPAPAHLR